MANRAGQDLFHATQGAKAVDKLTVTALNPLHRCTHRRDRGVFLIILTERGFHEDVHPIISRMSRKVNLQHIPCTSGTLGMKRRP